MQETDEDAGPEQERRPDLSEEDIPTDGVRVRVETSLSSIGRKTWDRLANPGWAMNSAGEVTPEPDQPDRPEFNPFLCYDFLYALEASGSATARTGWLGQHLILEDGSGEPAGAVPCYLKNHSQGEYVFDYGWADAFERAGGRYYPKLQISVPFTPVTARKLLVPPGDNAAENRALLASAVAELTRKHDASSAHLTFLPEVEWASLGEIGFLQRTDQQFHWQNDNYADFDEFLTDLSSRKRKNIRKERRDALQNDIEIEWVRGADLTEDHWDAFFTFYMDTGSRKWGTPYLTRSFFSMIGETMADRVLLIMAKRSGAYIAGALNLIGSHTLYGRNWGCIEDHPCLHFEVCYYQAIDFAIANGLTRVEAGAQGSHKLARGYLPNTVHSAHYVSHAGFRRAIADFLAHERLQVETDQLYLTDRSPFRKEN